MRDELIDGKEAEGLVFAGGDEIEREECGGVVGGLAAIFLEPLGFVDAFGADALEELFARFGAASLFVNALDQALSDGRFERDGMEAPAHRIAFLADIADELIENGASAAMGGDDRERAAPGGD